MIEQFCGKVLNVDIPSETQILLKFDNWLTDVYIRDGPASSGNTRSFSPPIISGQNFYVFSGMNDQITNVYDIDADTWTALTVGATKPEARYGHIGGIISNVLYVSHGYDIIAAANTQTTYALDLGTNTWTNKNPASKPSSRRLANTSSVVHGGKLYLIGGYTSAWQQDAYAYDPVANSWATLAAPTYACATPAAAAYGDYIYLVCGSNGLTNYLLRYDPVADSWATMSPCPNKGLYYTLTECDGNLHLIGGYMNRNGATQTGSSHIRDTWWMYDITKDRWYAKPQLNWPLSFFSTPDVTFYAYPFYYHTTVAYKSRLYIFFPYAGAAYRNIMMCLPNPNLKRFMVMEEERGI